MSTQIYKNTPDISPGHFLKRKVCLFSVIDLRKPGRLGGWDVVACLPAVLPAPAEVDAVDHNLSVLPLVSVLVIPITGR